MSAAAPSRLALFVLIRVTAVALAILVLGHFALTHLITDVAETDSSFVLRRWSSGLWVAWDWSMLVTALVHAGAGLWLMVDEQASSLRARRLLQRVLVATLVLLLAIGTSAIAVAGT